MHEAFQTDTMISTKEARAEAAKKQREMLGAFTEVQFAMYAAHQAEFNSHTMRKLEDLVNKFSKVLSELRETEDHLVNAMSPVNYDRGIGTGVTPAELEGARLRAEAEQSDGE